MEICGNVENSTLSVDGKIESFHFPKAFFQAREKKFMRLAAKQKVPMKVFGEGDISDLKILAPTQILKLNQTILLVQIFSIILLFNYLLSINQQNCK